MTSSGILSINMTFYRQDQSLPTQGGTHKPRQFDVDLEIILYVI